MSVEEKIASLFLSLFSFRFLTLEKMGMLPLQGEESGTETTRAMLFQ
jgi:hypothetical protein